MVWVLVAVLVLPALGGCRNAAPRAPDVIVVTLDTTRADHLSAYGYTRPTSPAIERFARDAIRYRHAWSTASWTLPAHASILTGLYPTSHGAHFNATAGEATLADALDGVPELAEVKVNRLGPEAVTLAEVLGGAGWATAVFAAGPWLTPAFGLLQGYAHQDADVVLLGGRRADEITDRALAWMATVPRDRPLHALVNYFDPHWPYEPPPGYDDLPAAGVPLTVTIPEVNRTGRLPADQRAAYVDRYDGEIRFMDHQFGRLMDGLRAIGRYDAALIIVVGDHGETFGEHGLMEHGRWLYEEVLRVPLLVHLPGGRDAGTESDAPVSVVDLLPLIARETGVPLPAGVGGVPPGGRTLVVAESFRDALAIRLEGARFDRDLVAAVRWPWKLIVPDRGAAELYRLDEDAHETDDRAGAPVEADLRDALAEARAGFVPPPAAAPPRRVEPKTREQLRGLGYVE